MFPKWHYYSLVVLFFFVSSCKMEHHPAKDVPTSAYSTKSYTYTFNEDIQPIFKQYCVSCHPGFSTYKNVKKKLSQIKERVLVKKTMPQGGSLSQDELKMIRIWIEEGAPEKGKKKAGVQKTKKPTVVVAKKSVVKKCTLCHGKDGISRNPGTPNLKGQSYNYLVARLITYKRGKEKSVMANIVKGLTQEEMKEVARYFSVVVLSSEYVSVPSLSEEERDQLFEKFNVKDSNVKEKLINGKCLECHGWKGPSRYAGVPYLAGQNIKYLKKQLNAFFMSEDTKKLRIHPMHLMMAWAKNVTGTWTKEDINGVAEFFSGLKKQYVSKTIHFSKYFPSILDDDDENAFSCITCHKPAVLVPQLAGQDRKYLIRQMKAFKENGRKATGSMGGQLDSIPNDSFNAIADYFSNIDYWKTNTPKAPKLISEKGCISCHGENGISSDKSIPYLAGQKTSYLMKRMKDFQKSSSHIMYFAVKDLNQDQLKAIADYYSAFKVDGTLKKASSK